MKKLIAIPLLAILIFFGASAIAIYFLTRAPEPATASTVQADANAPSQAAMPAPAVTMPDTHPAEVAPPATVTDARTPVPQSKRVLPSMPAPSAAVLHGDPVVPMSSDPEERAETLAEVRQERLTRMLEQRYKRPR